MAKINPYISHYSSQDGGVVPPYFRGTYSQPGYGLGSFFKSLTRFAVPFIKKNIIPLAKKGGKSLLKTGAKVLKDVILEEKPLHEAIFSRGKQQLGKILKSIDDNGNGIKQRKRKRVVKKSNKKQTNKKAKLDIFNN